MNLNGLVAGNQISVRTPSSGKPPVCEAATEGELPLATWGKQRLADRAEHENSCIGEDEGRVTPHYWFLGTVLNLLRSHYEKGTWESWLEQHRIDETRALRARQLAAAFVSPTELTGLSLRQALKLAQKRRGKKARGLDPKFARRLRAMAKTLEATVTELKRVEQTIASQRARLLGPARVVGDLLAELRNVCAEHPEEPNAKIGDPSPRKQKPR